jgi:NADH-quinone oxidoreductase subunit J
LVFELASFLLLIAAVGGVVLARRRGGLGEDDEGDALAPLDLARPWGTGTIAEGAGMLPPTDQGSPGRADRAGESRVETGAGRHS